MNANKKWSDEYIMDVYILGTINEEELAWFNQRMKDPTFVSELKWLQDLKIAASNKARSEQKEKLKKLEEHLSNQPVIQAKRRNLIPWITSIAAAMIVLIIVFFLFPKSVDHEQLFATNLEPFPNLVEPITKGITNTEMSPYHFYESGQYEKALAEWGKSDELDGNDRFYMGISNLMLGNEKGALQEFSFIDQTMNSDFEKSLQWYYLLCYMKAEEKKSMESLLEIIVSDQNHPYYSQATLLRDRLN